MASLTKWLVRALKFASEGSTILLLLRRSLFPQKWILKRQP
jgi:hypothetical protein